ncbi:response regulator [Microvirga massiliensis]|uniref:response regulator n=1 Tax=Microvirga massiliensis TaxID=1033741 RepID=UPI00062BB731|nr:response regulator [Microvirga massiliensis]
MGQAIRRKVLVVEDEPEVRSLAATLLEETDLQVVELDSADAALAFLENRADEVVMVFTDVALPGKFDGVDLTLACAARWPHIRVLVTSGRVRLPNDGLPKTARFIPKPWRAFDVLVAAERAAAHSA